MKSLLKSYWFQGALTIACLGGGVFIKDLVGYALFTVGVVWISWLVYRAGILPMKLKVRAAARRAYARMDKDARYHIRNTTIEGGPVGYIAYRMTREATRGEIDIFGRRDRGLPVERIEQKELLRLDYSISDDWLYDNNDRKKSPVWIDLHVKASAVNHHLEAQSQ